MNGLKINLSLIEVQKNTSKIKNVTDFFENQGF